MSGEVVLGPALPAGAGVSVLGAEWRQARVASKAAVAIGVAVRCTSVSGWDRGGG